MSVHSGRVPEGFLYIYVLRIYIYIYIVLHCAYIVTVLSVYETIVHTVGTR